MQISSSPSFFQDLKTRELNGFRVRKRPYLDDLTSDSGIGTGILMISHEEEPTPPLAVSFCKTSRNSHILAISDEDGYVSCYDTRRKLPSLTTCQENEEEAKVCTWIAHYNAVFDLCWIKEDTHILTASGDQTVKIWDVEKRKCIGIMEDHKGSVKSLCSHPSNSDLIVSGSRDGSLALWDLRCNSGPRSKHGEACLKSIAAVKDAHVMPQKRRVRLGKAANKSITSVLYLKDELSIASAGSVDSVIKFWDTRNLKAPISQAHPHFEPTQKERSLHGISSLSQDSNGVFIAASSMDNRIYLYNMLQHDKGPIKTFTGSQIKSFYVKLAISPDADHILSGSSDGNAYIWQVRKPQLGPILLKGHEGEVSAVDWCQSETGKVATASDDFMVRIWNIRKGSCSNTRSPSSIRRRVTAIPGMGCRQLFTDEPQMDFTKPVTSHLPSEETSKSHSSPIGIKSYEVGTPVAVKKRCLSYYIKEELEMQKTPEAATRSPSSGRYKFGRTCCCVQMVARSYSKPSLDGQLEACLQRRVAVCCRPSPWKESF